MNLFKQAWKKIVPIGRRPRWVLGGLYRGLRLELDLRQETQVWLGLYERETYPHITRLITSSAACVDIGAGKGELACYWLRHFPGRRIVAVEPSPVERATFRRNLALNFSTTPSELTVWPGFAGPGPVDTHRGLAALCTGLPGPIFIKIDIDGGEEQLLEETAAFLTAHPCRLLIEVHSVELEKNCTALLTHCGYTVRVIDFAYWRRWLREQRPIAHNRWITAEPSAVI